MLLRTPHRRDTVKWIYRTQNLPEPYKSDLAARIHEGRFVGVVGKNARSATLRGWLSDP
ncbi:hypothetical protein [Nocardia donostiensis]|uniref:hypothetical protein n=1 Tax=Nocardia donostiensis TaxID=1538463 RepID=UPI00318446D3